MTGICMRRKDAFDRDALHFAPFLLFPSPFPKVEFERALKLQPVLNELMHRVAHDRKFLEQTLQNTIKVDDFTRRLFEIFQKVWDEGLAQVMHDVLTFFVFRIQIFIGMGFLAAAKPGVVAL